jgi:GntR family transcriptional regulator, arabinose operon transcriptional repressor
MVGSKPKHQQIFEELHKAIVSGRYRPGQRVPSEGALVKRYKTSRPTVSRALRDLQLAGLLDRRVGSGSFVRETEVTAHRLLGLLIPGLGNTEIFEPICAEIARQATFRKYTLLWGHSAYEEGDVTTVMELCGQYIAQNVAGVFFAPIELVPGMEQVNHQIVAMLENAGIAVVLLDRDLEVFPKRSKYDLVGINNRRAGFFMTEYLLDLGCRRIEFVCRPFSAPTVADRIDGWRSALSAHGIDGPKSWLRMGNPADPEFVKSLAGGNGPAVSQRRQAAASRQNGGKRKSQTMADAFICANDLTAANLMRSLLNIGVRIPEDVRIVGIDDVKYAKLLSVPLTTLHQPCREIGAAAVCAMMERLANLQTPARDIFLDCSLAVRTSCGATLDKDRSPSSSGKAR